jgi:hypothetical protein
MSDIEQFLESLKSLPFRLRLEKIVDKIQEHKVNPILQIDSLNQEYSRVSRVIAGDKDIYSCPGCDPDYLLGCEVVVVNNTKTCCYCKSVVEEF